METLYLMTQYTTKQIIFGLTIINLVMHIAVLTNIWKPEFDRLMKGRWFFCIDMITPLVGIILYNSRFSTYEMIHIIVVSSCHLFYVTTWYNGYYAQRILGWTSRPKSLTTYSNHFTWDFPLTIMDIMSHIFILNRIL